MFYLSIKNLRIIINIILAKAAWGPSNHLIRYITEINMSQNVDFFRLMEMILSLNLHEP